jgi:parvulin-like peptidyl-prolyl isomerase
VVAASSACQRDQFERAIAAQLNVNMRTVADSAQWQQFFAPLGNAQLTVDQVLDQLLPLQLHTQFAMMLHELVHILGFTTPQFSVRTRHWPLPH